MKSIQRVIIEDFQSHRYTELELAQGFNVIVGPSDQGKTAVLRAVRWVLYNDPRGTDFIRVGATKAKVSLVMNDGTLVTRERSSSRNRYSIAIPGEAEEWYEGFGQSVPEEVMEATGVRLAKIDEDHQVAINLGMQLDPPFLLDNNGSIKAKAIGRINGVHILDYAHKTTSSELNSKQIEERRIQAELERINEQLKHFEDLDDWQQKLEQLDGGFVKVKELDHHIEWFQERSHQRVDLSKKLILADQYLSRLSSIDLAGEKWTEVTALEQKWAILVQLQQRLESTRAFLLEASHVIQQTERLTFTSPMLTEVEQQFNLLQSLQKAMEHKSRLGEELNQIHTLLNKTKDLNEGEQRFVQLSEWLVKEQQLVLLQTKDVEYRRIREKIDIVLSKTDQIYLAEEQWEQWKAQEQVQELFIGFLKRRNEGMIQLEKIRMYIDLTEQLDHSEQMLKQVEKIVLESELLLQYRDKLKQIEQDKTNFALEITLIEENLEGYAEQYFKVLKKIGKCPICLGEIESHTAQRIVAEMNG